MLERLIIENLALIEKLDLELDRGFTVLTGETGAGKSIIIDGIDLILGGRGSRELISYGKDKCRVGALFDVSGNGAVLERIRELELDSGDGTLTVMRELTMGGKSLCRVNGAVVPLSSLKFIAERLVDIHGQHEHQSLLDDKNHLGVIDSYSADSIAPLIEEVDSVFREYSETVSRLNSGFISEAERQRRIDILNFQIREIESANLIKGEEERIKEELNVLVNSEKISNSVNSASEKLNGDRGAVNQLRHAVAELSEVSGFSSQLNEVFARLNDLYYEVEDASFSLRSMTGEIEFDPARIDALELRLDAIDSLKRKYGKSIEEVLEFASAARAELDTLSGNAELRESLEKKKKELLREYSETAGRLTAARKASAQKLCRLAQDELVALGMKKARLSAEFSIIDDEPHENGSDAVSFLLSANEGEPLKPLSKIASGGELSRIMLALKTVITDADGIPTLVFDEVDSGISGTTANTVGLRIRRIAKKHQVLCVTHLPQIAAFSDTHYAVMKDEVNGRTVTHVKKLSEAEKPVELARIMGAEGSGSAAVEHAAELIRKARDAD